MGGVAIAAIAGGIGITAGTVTWMGALLSVGAAIYMDSQAKKREEEARRMAAANQIRGYSDLSRVSAASRKFVYGTNVKRGGDIIFDDLKHDNKNIRYVIIALAAHKVSSPASMITDQEELYIDDEGYDTFTTDGDGWKTPVDTGTLAANKYTNTFKFKQFYAADGAFDSQLETELGSSVWDSTHTLTEIAYVVLKLTYNRDVFSYGVPKVLFRIDGKEVLDPRTSVTAVSDNAALCILDYLQNTRIGMAAPDAAVDLTSFQNAANVSDQVVDGEARYTVHGVVDSAVLPKDNMQSMLDVCVGRLFTVSGIIKLYVGAYVTPTLVFDEDDIRGSLELVTRRPKRDLMNIVKGVNIDPISGTAVSYPEVTNATYTAADGEDLEFTLDLPMCNSNKQCQRVAKIVLERNRRESTFKFPCSVRAMELHAFDTIYMNMTRYGWTNKVWEVSEWEFNPGDGKKNPPHVMLGLSETDADVYNAYTTTAYSAIKSTNLPPPNEVIAPTGLGVVEQAREVGDVLQNWAIFSWTAADSAFTAGYEVRYKKSSESTWVYWNGNVTGTDVEIPVNDSGDYDFSIRTRNELGIVSAWTSTTHTIVGITEVPDNFVFDTTDSEFTNALYLYWSKDTSNQFSYSEIRLDTNWGVVSDQLLYRGKRTSLVVEADIIFNLVGSRTATVYGSHYNTSNNPSAVTDSMARVNAVPAAPTFTASIDGNIAIIKIDLSATEDDVIGHRITMSDTLGGVYTQVAELGKESTDFTYIIPYSDIQWDGVESITKFFKVAAVDSLTDFIGDQSSSTAAAQSVEFLYRDESSLSLSTFEGASTIQLFLLEEWGYDAIDLFAQIDFDSTTTYDQIVSLEADTWYSIAWSVLSGTPELDFTVDGTPYQLNSTTTAIRFYTGSTEEEVTFTISGVNTESVARMMLNEGRFSYIYTLHVNDAPTPTRTQDQLNLITQQLGESLKTIGGLQTDFELNGSEINQSKYLISLKVGKDGIVSSLNLSPQGAKISGRHIVLDGLTRFINSSTIVYGEVTRIEGSTVYFTVGSLQEVTSGTFYQDGGNFTFTLGARDEDGVYTGTVTAGTPALGFFADGNVPSTTIDGDLLTTGTVAADAIIAGSISTEQLDADEIFAERVEIIGTQNIVMDNTNGILLFDTSAVNTYTSTASGQNRLTKTGTTLVAGDWIRILDGNNARILKKVTSVSGPDIFFSAMNVTFDSAAVQFQTYTKATTSYTQLTGGTIEIVGGAAAGTVLDSNGLYWDAVFGTTRPEDNATNSTVYRQGTDPDLTETLTQNDIWYDTITFIVSKWNGASWDVIGNAYDDTTQLNDGAALGDTANWSEVVDDDGNIPQDNATEGATWGVDITDEPTELGDINSTEGTKLTGVATGATKNIFTSSASTPGGTPTTGDLWYDTTNQVIKQYNGASWDQWAVNPDYITKTKITSTEVESPTISGNSGYFSDIVRVGTVGSRVIINGTAKTIGSENYVAGTSGWQIDGDGSAHFTSVSAVIRALSYSEVSVGGSRGATVLASFGYEPATIPMEGDADNVNTENPVRLVVNDNVNAAADFLKIICSFYFKTDASTFTEKIQGIVTLKTITAGGSEVTQTINGTETTVSSSTAYYDTFTDTPDSDFQDSLAAGRPILVQCNYKLWSTDTTANYRYSYEAKAATVQLEYLTDTTAV